MAKAVNPRSHAEDLHQDAPDGAMQAFDAQYQKFDITNSFGTVDPLARTGSQMYYGSGNTTTNFHITENDTLDFQLDLKEKVRQGPDIAPTSTDPDGTAHFNAPSGTQVGNPARAAWSFDFAVVTGLDGSKHDLRDFDFKMVITQNGTNTHTFDLNPTTHEWIDESNSLIKFSGDDFNQPATADVQAHVAENSVNLGFGPMQAAFGPLATSTAAGTTYDIKIEAFDHTHFVGMVHDAILLV